MRGTRNPRARNDLLCRTDTQLTLRVCLGGCRAFNGHKTFCKVLAAGYNQISTQWFRRPLFQEDIDEGYVYNNATLEGRSPSGVKFATADAEVVKVPRKMNISVERILVNISQSEGSDSTYSDPGDSATFKVNITNTGNTVLNSVELNDSVVDAEAIDCDQDFTSTDSKFFPDSHPSGAPLICHVTAPLTASYVDAGGFNSTSEVRSLRADPCWHVRRWPRGSCRIL